jgi:hypothetical protein
MVRAVAELPHPEKPVVDLFGNQFEFFCQTDLVFAKFIKRTISQHGASSLQSA